MKRLHTWNGKQAMTMTEVMVVVVIVLFMAGFVMNGLMPLTRRGCHPPQMRCRSNLKQIDLAFRVFSNDNDDKYPYFSRDRMIDGKSVPNAAYANEKDAWLYFLVMSNELGSVKILTCPSDRERINNMAVDFSSNSVAPNFGLGFQQNSAVSYFVGLDADETRPQMLLAGDRNLMTNAANLHGSVLTVASNLPPVWSASIHTNAGNVALSDGSVQQMNTAALANHLRQPDSGTNRLLLPLIP